MAVDIKRVLRKHIVKVYGSQKKAAEAWGCTATNVSMALRGQQEPNKAMLAAIGYRRVKQDAKYEKIKDEAKI